MLYCAHSCSDCCVVADKHTNWRVAAIAAMRPRHVDAGCPFAAAVLPPYVAWVQSQKASCAPDALLVVACISLQACYVALLAIVCLLAPC